MKNSRLFVIGIIINLAMIFIFNCHSELILFTLFIPSIFLTFKSYIQLSNYFEKWDKEKFKNASINLTFIGLYVLNPLEAYLWYNNHDKTLNSLHLRYKKNLNYMIISFILFIVIDIVKWVMYSKSW